MYLLTAAFVSLFGQAHAGDLQISNICKLPCLNIGIGTGSSIIPDDWYGDTLRSLDGNLFWYRVAVSANRDVEAVYVGDYALSERFYSSRESDERWSVYYVPASQGARITVYEGERGEITMYVSGSDLRPF